MTKKGFTLVELLVVIGIIAILGAALTAGFSGATKMAQKTRGQELVSAVATALTSIYQKSGQWPKPILDGNGANENRLGPGPGAMLAKHGGFSLSFRKDSSTGKYTLTGQDKLGVLDPWGQAVMKSRSSAGLGTRVPSGGTVNDHIVRYAIDRDGLGFVEATVCGKSIRVRGSAIAWCCGPDGRFDDLSKMGRSDDIFSFTQGQIVNSGE